MLFSFQRLALELKLRFSSNCLTSTSILFFKIFKHPSVWSFRSSFPFCRRMLKLPLLSTELVRENMSSLLSDPSSE